MRAGRRPLPLRWTGSQSRPRASREAALPSIGRAPGADRERAARPLCPCSLRWRGARQRRPLDLGRRSRGDSHGGTSSYSPRHRPLDLGWRSRGARLDLAATTQSPVKVEWWRRRHWRSNRSDSTSSDDAGHGGGGGAGAAPTDGGQRPPRPVRAAGARRRAAPRAPRRPDHPRRRQRRRRPGDRRHRHRRRQVAAGSLWLHRGGEEEA